ncbi:uncharacterized protein LOC142583610 isoform X1 [Dermacentor variabilis]|uniref:uncharacterized protein LOC142583610 isoform X1 n=1 Tax=Dermacentor variabilis TaxID=34621 RepID=UPI003F5BF706
MANVGTTFMRQSSFLDVVAKKIRHGTISLDSLKYRALEKWSLSQVSSQQASMDIGNPAINKGNSIYHANSSGLDPKRAHSPFTGNCSSITVTQDGWQLPAWRDRRKHLGRPSKRGSRRTKGSCNLPSCSHYLTSGILVSRPPRHV